jgi:hypothetical protein
MPAKRQTRSTKTRERRTALHSDTASVSVRILERPTHRTLIVSWREAGRCCYCEQSWALTEAATAGTCALSGDAFATGEHIFKPADNPAPINAQACIAERAVNDWTALIESEIG